MSYQFLDANGSVLTAASNAVGGAQQPIVQVSSITGTVPVSVIGTVPVTMSGSNTTSVVGTVGASVLGTVPITQGGSFTTSVVGTVGASMIGTVPITQGGSFTTSVVGTVGGSIIGTVPITQGGAFTASVVGTVGVTQAGAFTTSIVGAYAEDTAHVGGSTGVFVMGVRNDTMASTISANGEYGQLSVGPSGEQVAVNAPYTNWVQGNASVFTGSSVQAIAPQGANVFTYVTGVQIANASANNVFVRFTGGLGSTLGWTIAPANGGSNITYPNGLKTGANAGFSASVSGVSSVYVSAQGFVAGS